jgi:hypothetical protein
MASIVQIYEARLTANKSRTSTTFGTFVSKTLTVAANSTLLVVFNAYVSGSVSTEYLKFRLLLDSVVVAGCVGSIEDVNHERSFNICWPSDPLSAGSHTVEIQWASTAGAMTCNASTSPDDASARMTIIEISGAVPVA